jgi:hypothetical protein
MTEFTSELFGLSVDHYVAVVVVEVACHVVHNALKHTRKLAGKLRERRSLVADASDETPEPRCPVVPLGAAGHAFA